MFLVLAALLSPALATTYWRPPPPRVISNLWRDEGECQLRAWVRAEDLRQNGVSHGELRVRLLEPCAVDEMAAVRLHLRLDEFMEHAETPQKMLDIPKWNWEKSSGAVTSSSNTTVFNSTVEWSLTPDTVAVAKSDNGLVMPFSVVVPDVRFPRGVFPLTFGFEDFDRHVTLNLGLAYRYVATVRYLNGTEESTAAGFTSFIGGPPASPVASGEVSLETSIVLDRSLTPLEEEGDPCSFEATSQLGLKVVFPKGNAATPGQDIIFEAALESSDPPGATTELSVSFSLLARSDDPYLTGGHLSYPVHFNPLRTPYLDENSRNGIEGLLTTSFSTFRIPVPSTASLASRATYFTPGAALTLRVRRNWNQTSTAPMWGTESEFLPQDYTDATSISGGWALGECDRSWYKQRSYSASVEVQLANEQESGPSYLAADHVTVPKLLQGQVARDIKVDFDLARPEKRETVFQGLRFLDNIEEPVHELEGFIGQYVGALWSKYQARHSTSSASTVGDVGSSIQQVLSHK